MFFFFLKYAQLRTIKYTRSAKLLFRKTGRRDRGPTFQIPYLFSSISINRNEFYPRLFLQFFYDVTYRCTYSPRIGEKLIINRFPFPERRNFPRNKSYHRRPSSTGENFLFLLPSSPSSPSPRHRSRGGNSKLPATSPGYGNRVTRQRAKGSREVRGN